MIDIMSGTDTDVVSSSNPKRGSKAGVVVAFLCLVALAAGGSYWVKSHSKAAATVATPEQSVAAVRDADAAWAKAAAARDVEGTIAYYADDAVVMAPNVAMAMDKGAQRKEWADILTPGTNLSWTAGKIEASKDGGLVYDVGIYTMITKEGKGKVTTDGGKYLAVWKKQADGKWKAVAATWNSDKALPGKPAKG